MRELAVTFPLVMVVLEPEKATEPYILGFAPDDVFPAEPSQLIPIPVAVDILLSWSI
jgi:hypothetical protein